MRRILFSTGNKFKLAQMQYVSDYFNMGIKIISARDIFGTLAKFEKIGSTPEEVALRGARTIYNKIKRPIIIEETFLEVDALNGFPGIKSIPFVKTKGRKALLAMLAGEKNRDATMKSAAVFINEKGEEKIFKHEIKGEITTEERWIKGPLWVSPEEEEWGGWYNAIFKPKNLNKTLAELTAEELIKHGYRERVFKQVLEAVKKEPDPEL